MDYHELAGIISPERLQTYLKNAGNNHDKAIKLYLQNLKYVQQFFPIIIEFEVLLRNAINHRLIETYGKNWHANKVIFTIRHQQDITNAILKIKRRVRGKITNGDIVAALSLGF